MSRFKAIIVGGGPAGLVTGHCLAKAGIDFEILESRAKHEVGAGGSNALWPHNVRVFDQLGLLEETRKLHGQINHKVCVLGDGKVFYRSDAFAQVEVQHGHPFMVFHRGELLELLERRLPGRESRLHTNKQVTAIETTNQGVSVICADGSTFGGSIVIGADGVHSTVRRLMDEQSPQASTSTSSPMTTTYVGLYGTCPLLPGLDPSVFYETHGPAYSMQLAINNNRCMFIIYHRLNKPTKARHHFSGEEKEALAARYADTHITPHHTFSDVWKAVAWSHMAHIEEGLASTWHEGRVVLVGDAIHKMTPNAGFGFNNAVTSTVALTNGLRRLLLQRGHVSSLIDTEALTGVFAAYEETRRPQAKKSIEVSASYSRAVAWDNLLWKVIDRYIGPHINMDVMLLKLLMSPLVREGVVLDFLEESNFKEGTVKWAIPKQTSLASDDRNRG
ncbi:FAD binding domain-containing protein [Lasiosphaeria hispida]|uniref:FAD binding domain-containing protein n=1 Tax=Lasiosphaeria hispida TaxID=260671 RepID=A0AAJ0MGI8_9PEZI|nr:FAD binding domain-containing protein [Lasiosphaeria hispida]